MMRQESLAALAGGLFLTFFLPLEAASLFVPAPEPKPPLVVPGYYELLNGGVWDFHLKADGSLVATHPHSDIVYTGFWRFDRQTNVLTVETLSGPGGSERWNTDRHLITPAGSRNVDTGIESYFKKIMAPRQPQP